MTAAKLMDEAILERLTQETSAAMVERMISLFVMESKKRRDALSDAAHSTAIKIMEDQAHTLKSSAATFGAMSLWADARALEAACQQGQDDPVCLALVTALLSTLDETLGVYQARFNIQ